MSKVFKTSMVWLVAAVISLTMAASVSAHVVVKPSQVLTSERLTFMVSVPNEHDTPVVGVRLVIPEGLTSVRPNAKAGWNIEVVKTGEGEDVSASEIIWTSNGENIPVNLRDEFLFSAKAPDTATELQWKAYETYQDGKVVGWDQEPSESEDNKPFSVTNVVSETEDTKLIKEAQASAEDADNSSNTALYTAIAAAVLGLIAIALATRKR